MAHAVGMRLLVVPEAVQWFAAACLPGRAGRASWEQVRSQDIQRWVAWLLDRYSSAYASNHYRALQQFFKWLASEDQKIQYRPHLIDGCLAGTGLKIEPW